MDQEDVVSENQSGDGDEPSSPPASAVGALLRASRLRLGEDLRDVARVLRIRYPYLEAIEEGRYGDLPGTAYAVGFVRGYAEHLGLDSEEIVRRYKAETAGGPKKPRLVFPSPVTESVMPGGAAVFIGIVLAGLAYGIWYVGTSDDNPIADIIGPIPERLSEILNQKATPDETREPAALAARSSSPSSAETATPEADAETARTEPAPAPVEAAPAEKADAETEKAEPAPAATDEPVPAEKADAKVEKAAPASAPAATAKPAPTATAETPPATTAEVAPAAEAETAKVEKTEAAPPSVPAAAVPATAPAPKPAGPVITVKAKSPSWIQVRDDVAKTLVMTRLLRPGDTYQVPDQPGLSLVTGNAGALEILVDGAPVPAIGGSGAVRRSVALDAAKLKAGKAVGE